MILSGKFTLPPVMTALAALYNGGSLKFYSGPMPSLPTNPIRAINTLLATATFANPALKYVYQSYMRYCAELTLANNPFTPVAGGVPCFARATTSDGANTLADFAVAAVRPYNSAVSAGEFAVSDGKTYLCIQSGTTNSDEITATAGQITDGTAKWVYWGFGAPDIMFAERGFSTSRAIELALFQISLHVV